jgi:hypothetical protein
MACHLWRIEQNRTLHSYPSAKKLTRVARLKTGANTPATKPYAWRAEFFALPITSPFHPCRAFADTPIRRYAHSPFRLLQLLYLIPSSLQGSDQAVVADKVAGANDYEIIAVTLEETFYLR